MQRTEPNVRGTHGGAHTECADAARMELAALLAENKRLRRAAEGIDTFAWSSMKADCEEARVEGMKRIGAVRAALAAAGMSNDNPEAAIALVVKIRNKIQQALAPLEREMRVTQWRPEYRAIVWEAVAREAIARAADARNG